MLPFFDGERMPNLPDATGVLGGISRLSLTPENMARSVVEAVVSNLSRGIEAIVEETEKTRATHSHRRWSSQHWCPARGERDFVAPCCRS